MQANHFPTPSVADGLLLAPSADHVVAFTASARASTTKPTPTPSPVPPAGIVVAGLVVIGGMGWLVWRRADHRNSS